METKDGERQTIVLYLILFNFELLTLNIEEAINKRHKRVHLFHQFKKIKIGFVNTDINQKLN